MDTGPHVTHINAHVGPPTTTAAELRREFSRLKEAEHRLKRRAEYLERRVVVLQAELNKAEEGEESGGEQDSPIAGEDETLEEAIASYTDFAAETQEALSDTQQRNDELRRELELAEALETLKARGERRPPHCAACRRRCGPQFCSVLQASAATHVRSPSAAAPSACSAPLLRARQALDPPAARRRRGRQQGQGRMNAASWSAITAHRAV
jgi:hypothetical protein